MIVTIETARERTILWGGVFASWALARHGGFVRAAREELERNRAVGLNFVGAPGGLDVELAFQVALDLVNTIEEKLTR